MLLNFILFNCCLVVYFSRGSSRRLACLGYVIGYTGACQSFHSISMLLQPMYSALLCHCRGQRYLLRPQYTRAHTKVEATENIDNCCKNVPKLKVSNVT